MEMRVRSGPLPAPEDLERYNTIIPNGAERILHMAEEQQKHRMHLEKYALHSDSRRSWAGLAAGLVVVLAVLGASVWLIAGGHEVSGTIFGGLDLVGLAGTFVYGSRLRRQERMDKAKIMAGSQQR